MHPLIVWLFFAQTVLCQIATTAPPTITPAPVLLDRRQDAVTTTTTSSTSIPATAPAGGLKYTKPAVTDAISYYKVASGNLVTFGWSYTSLYVTPTSLTFEAYCSANSVTYNVGPTTGVAGTATEVVWDLYASQQTANAVPYAQASYTLRVYDERGSTAAATAGYFNGDNAVMVFALYSPASYTSLADGWTCVSCSFATALSSHPALLALPVTLTLVFLGGLRIFVR